MKRVTRARLYAWPWAGFLLGGLGFVLSHQIGSTGNYDACSLHGWPDVLLAGVLCLGLAGTGALLSWRLWRRGEHHETAPRRFIALVSTLAAGLFAFAIVPPMVASLLIPRCFG
jgi:hypothetical protein